MISNCCAYVNFLCIEYMYYMYVHVCFNEKHEFYLVVRSHSLEIILKVANYMLQKTHHHNSFKLLVFAVLSTRVQRSWNAKNVRKNCKKKRIIMQCSTHKKWNWALQTINQDNFSGWCFIWMNVTCRVMFSVNS